MNSDNIIHEYKAFKAQDRGRYKYFEGFITPYLSAEQA